MGFGQRELTTRYLFGIFGLWLSYQSRSNQIKLCSLEIMITAGTYVVDVLRWENKAILEISSEHLHMTFPSGGQVKNLTSPKIHLRKHLNFKVDSTRDNS